MQDELLPPLFFWRVVILDLASPPLQQTWPFDKLLPAPERIFWF